LSFWGGNEGGTKLTKEKRVCLKGLENKNQKKAQRLLQREKERDDLRARAHF